MLHHLSFHQDHARIQGKPYHQFTSLSPIKWACGEVCTNSKKLILQGWRRRCGLYKALMIYQNTPLTSNMQSPLQILQKRTARLQLPMANGARIQLGLEMEKLRIKTKNENLPSHDLHLSQDVMMQDHASKRWSPAVIIRLVRNPEVTKSLQETM